MASVDREVTQGPQKQGADETVAYKIDTGPWGGTPTSVTVKAYKKVEEEYTEVTSTVLSGSASVSSNTITLPKLTALTEGLLYRIEVQFTEAGGNTYETYIYVQAER